ncbi:LysR substrate-binding domain-containing protein [Devosia elaeis]|uniref:Transcriptional regulator n=1 Tax=Devosia elaeis TaxID=1770058 RepID=A0A178HW82_9HYPH|nr:LysR substrate-binding domain-containing protein [Devosia elaeis]OAM76949.1 transcriptional regulator [Devosia elaeis]
MANKKVQPISVKHIENYDAIAATGSTSAAAAALGLSQSNASRMLQQLEEYLGVELFYRDKNRLSPTKEGTHLGPEIRAIADRLQALRTSARELEAGTSKQIRLRIAFPSSLTVSLVPPMLGQFRQSFPNVSVEIFAGPYTAIERMVVDGVADIGFTRVPLTLSGLRREFEIGSRNVCALHEDHPLASRKSLTVAELEGHDMVLLNRERPARHELEAIFYKAGLRLKPVAEAHSVACACALAAANLGITIVSELLARPNLAANLRLVPLEPILPVNYAVIMSEKTAAPKVATLFVRHLQEWLEKNAFGS